jgi:hypothetical protein
MNINKKLHPYVENQVSWVERLQKDLEYTLKLTTGMIADMKEKNFVTLKTRERIKILSDGRLKQITDSLKLKKERKQRRLRKKHRRQYI